MLTLLNSQIGLLIGAITVIGLVWGPRAWPAVYNWIGNIWKSITSPFRGTERRIETLANQHAEMLKKLDVILEQFSPNGGTTVKDSLNRIERRQAVNEIMSVTLANSMDIAMFKTEADGSCSWASKAYLRLTGRTLEDTLGFGWILAIKSSDRASVREEWASAVIEKTHFEKIFTVVNTNGDEIRINCRASPSLLNHAVMSWVGYWEEEHGS
jgi:PAS domain-containing protein